MFPKAFQQFLVRLALLGIYVSACVAAAPKLLIVVAHPDDDFIVAATVYRIATELGGTVDEFVITNGEGGYRYATLAEPYYGLELTREEAGRRELPAIRKRELSAAGRILGVRQHYFLDESDINNTADPNDVLGGTWDSEKVIARLRELLVKEQYEFVFTALPRPDIGGHHLAATILTLRAVSELDRESRPVVLGAHPVGEEFAAPAGSEFIGFTGAPDYAFDRTTKFGFSDALDYQIIVNWMIAEHKSQGLYQRLMGQYTHEFLWVFNREDSGTRDLANRLFELLKVDKRKEQ